MSKKLPSLLPMFAALTLAGCFGGGGGGNDSTGGGTTAPTTTSGRAVDGYLSGSTVYCDTDKNGRQDSGEVSGTTDASGNFSLPGACAGVVVVSSGTDTTTGYAFKGLLKGTPGSAYVTPLTTLLADTGLTEAQLNAALGLPAGTSVTSIDPMAAGNEVVLQRTLAVQQLVQQVANTMGAATTPQAITAIYAKVAAAVAKAIVDAGTTPLFNANGTVSTTVLTAAVQGAVDSINADASLPDVDLDTADVAALATGVATQAEKFLQASTSSLVELAKDLQNPANPPVDTPTAQANYIYPKNDSVVLNGVSTTLAQFTAGTTITGLNSIGLEYGAEGSPEIDKVVDVGMSLESANDSRVIQVKTEQVRVVRDNATGTVTLKALPETKVHIYARDNRGATFNVSLSGADFNPVTVVNNAVTVSYATLVERVVNSSKNTSSFVSSQFANVTGEFVVKFAVSTNLNVRYQDGTRLPVVNVGVTGTDKGVEGPGIAGKLTIN